MSSLPILAPFDGWCSSLDEVPDSVFAGRMLGDGLAIDPTSGILTAPCAGEIITLPASAHAVSIRTPQGIELLIHVGIDTVHLAGRGFEARVRPGAKVRAGDELIRLDLDVVARGAKSLMTPIVVMPLDGLELRQRRAPGLVSAGELLFEIAGIANLANIADAAAGLPSRSAQPPAATAGHVLIVTLRQGLHARPAALLAQRAKSFGAQATLAAHGRTANARSVVAIMALGVRQGDELTIQASGADAAEAVASLVAGIQEALRMESAAGHGAAARTDPAAPINGSAPVSQAAPVTGEAPVSGVVPVGGAMPNRFPAGVLGGVIAAAGLAVGRATRIERREIDVTEHGMGPAHERAELEQARTHVRARLERVAETGGATRREIIAAHLEFLDDPQVNETAQELIAAGKSAGFAWRAAIRRSIIALEALDDSRMRERADDLLDVESHVLLALAGEARPMILPLPERAVLIADDLLPSELTALDPQRLLAICLGGGGATSHVAILAAAMEIPMLVGLGAGIRAVANGTTVIVDADGGTLQWAPTAAAIEQAEAAVESRLERRAKTQAEAQTECRALDGTRIEVFANLGNVLDAAAAVANGAEGCGLLRTEFLFIDRETAPDEAEQLAAYQGIAAALGPKPLILRLMDVGGDKPLRYLPLPAEQNPALGLRGVRTALARPDLLRAQLRAALRVQPFGRVRLLIPMITDVAEVLAVRGLINELLAELALPGPIELGAMIETPAAALTASVLIREVDFLSIGSNDLTQYTLAMDRGHPQLAGRTDALHPAVLKLVAEAASAGVAAGKMVAVCGGAAADRFAVPLLLGLGVRELSVVPAAVPAVKQQVRRLRIADCRELALRCLDLASSAEVRALIAPTLGPVGDTR
ncbi:MAG TPA: phosphoenolpyruvate--protein phosphotransferase [Steroidobacteraceae bacterium]|nr:phosphoenolpyruvate--protein phosphotransferase [Steroidobacteraceae bacterium]